MPNGIEFRIYGDETVKDELDSLPGHLKNALKKAFVRCGNLAVSEAMLNCPKSPTNKKVSKHLKVKRKTKRRTNPGGLEHSIRFESDENRCSIFVPSNSDGGPYARYIHDCKGKLWFKRGIGTERKGARADDKFIERAINDNVDKYLGYMNEEMLKENGVELLR